MTHDHEYKPQGTLQTTDTKVGEFQGLRAIPDHTEAFTSMLREIQEEMVKRPDSDDIFVYMGSLREGDPVISDTSIARAVCNNGNGLTMLKGAFIALNMACQAEEHLAETLEPVMKFLQVEISGIMMAMKIVGDDVGAN
jgi:hypothetical protein